MDADTDLGTRGMVDLSRLRDRMDRNLAWSRRLDATSRELAEALAATEESTATVLEGLSGLESMVARRDMLAQQARRTAADLRSWAARPGG